MISPIDYQGQEGFVKYVLQLELNRGSMGGNVLGNILALTDSSSRGTHLTYPANHSRAFRHVTSLDQWEASICWMGLKCRGGLLAVDTRPR